MKVRAIAFYLPQFHPIPENDEWWGKGFTEWTNVGKAKPLFWGHDQPKVPADLGYYDLRLSEVRSEQAELARSAGIEGFCYWHYWFGNGRTLMETPFQEVLKSEKPDFPFCLAWANHSWYNKTWNKSGEDRLLIKQEYLGEQDYESHFFSLLPAFKDQRYIRVNDRPIFFIFQPLDDPNISLFIKKWNDLACLNGIKGIYFIAISKSTNITENLYHVGYSAISLDMLSLAFFNRSLLRKIGFRCLRTLFGIPKIISYDEYIKFFSNFFPKNRKLIPTVVPNFDHSPRSGKYAPVVVSSSPSKFKKLLTIALSEEYLNDEKIVIIRSWNEWAEGNYLEPDSKFGREYLDVLKEVLDE